VFVACDDRVARQRREFLIVGRDNHHRLTTSPSNRTTRCSIVSDPNGSNAFDDPMRVDLPPHNTMPASTIPSSGGLSRAHGTARAVTLQRDERWEDKHCEQALY
jgi:hypothetical protein